MEEDLAVAWLIDGDLRNSEYVRWFLDAHVAEFASFDFGRDWSTR